MVVLRPAAWVVVMAPTWVTERAATSVVSRAFSVVVVRPATCVVVRLPSCVVDSAADWVLVPTQLERLSLEGVAFMSQTCGELVRERGHGPRLLGVVPNMARRQTIEHRAQMDELVAAFGAIVWPPIPLSVRVAEACAFGTTLFKHAPDEPVTDAIRTIGQRLIKNLEG